MRKKLYEKVYAICVMCKNSRKRVAPISPNTFNITDVKNKKQAIKKLYSIAGKKGIKIYYIYYIKKFKIKSMDYHYFNSVLLDGYIIS